LKRFFVGLGYFIAVIAMQNVSQAGPCLPAPTAADIAKIKTLFNIESFDSANYPVWSQLYSTYQAQDIAVRWLTDEDNVTSARWEAWEVPAGTPILSPDGTGWPSGVCPTLQTQANAWPAKWSPTPLIIPKNAFLSQAAQPPTRQWLLRIVVLGKNGNPIGVPSGLVSVVQQPPAPPPAAPPTWPTNDQVPQSHTLLEVANPPVGSATGFVWSQHLSTSTALAVYLRWSTAEAGVTGASWQAWALTDTQANGKVATVVAKGTVTGPPGQFLIAPNAFQSNQAPPNMTMYLVQLTVLGAGGTPIGKPSNFVRVAQYPEPSSSAGTYSSWEGYGDDSRESAHPFARFVSYEPPTNTKDGSLTLRFINNAAASTVPVYVEVNDGHGFVGRTQPMPTVPALAKGAAQQITLPVAFLRGVPHHDAMLSLKVFTRKATTGAAIDPWEQPQSKPSYEGPATSCDGWGCGPEKVSARFEGYDPPVKGGSGTFTVVFFNDGKTPTLPVMASAVDVNKHLVMDGTSGFPIPGLQPGQMYRVDFWMKPTEPNGVPAKPLDIQLVTAAIQPHVFTGLADKCAGTGCWKPSFNLESAERDDNGLLLNPIWHYQWDVGLLDPTRECANLGAGGTPPPNCSTQMTYWQNVNYGGPATVCGSDWGLGDGHFSYFPATYTGHIKAHDCSGPDGDVCFDLRPKDVDLLPTQSFQVFSQSDAMPVVPGVHSGATSSAYQWHLEMNSSATTDRFGSKWWTHYRDIATAPAFTVDVSPPSCPLNFEPDSGNCHAGSTCMVPMLDENDSFLGNMCLKPVEAESVVNKEAIVAGLVSLDCMHSCEEELHPIYMMAIHMKDDPDDDVWAIVANNAGEQGSCGHQVIGAHLGDKKAFRLRLWRPTAFRKDGMTVGSVVEAAGTQLMHPKGGPEKRTKVQLDGQDAIIDITLPTPTADVIVSQFTGFQEFSGQGGDNASGFIEGVLHLKWTAHVAAQPTIGGTGPNAGAGAVPSSPSHDSAIPPPFHKAPLQLRAPVAPRLDADDDEAVFPRLLEQAPPEAREALRARFVKPHATAAPPVETLAPDGAPSATPPVSATDPPLEWRRTAGPAGQLYRDTERIRALCDAFKGNIPRAPAGTCAPVK
jgi:hypothetical protein